MNEATPFFHHFEKVFNSYYAHSDKGNVSWFADVLCETGVKPENALFIDDRQGNIERAKSVGINTIHFTGQKEFLKELSTYIS